MRETKPLHIAFLLSSLKFGGAERVAMNLAKALHADGITVDMLLMSHEGEFLTEASQYCNVIDLQCNRTYKLPWKLLIYNFRHHPDVLISSFWKLNLCSSMARIFYPKLRLLLWEHSPPSKSKNSPIWLYALSSSIFYQLAHKVVTVSTGVHDDVARWTVGLKRKLVVIFNPVTPPAEMIHKKRYLRKFQQVVWVGRLDGPKNPILALEAFALAQSTSNVRLVFLGEGNLREKLEQRCVELRLTSRVSFPGFHPNPYEVMAESDLLILSSDREGLPTVIIESMFMGLRVVATNCGKGIDDILSGGKYGTVVEPNNPEDMARAIDVELEKHHEESDQIIGAQRFLPEVIAKQFMELAR